MDRFATGALAWWLALVGLVQAQLGHALAVPPAPDCLAGKARTPAKERRLVQGWHLVYLLGLLLALLGRALDCQDRLRQALADQLPRECWRRIVAST